jgi:hypothetical protein
LASRAFGASGVRTTAIASRHPGAGRDLSAGRLLLLITFHRPSEPASDSAAETLDPDLRRDDGTQSNCITASFAGNAINGFHLREFSSRFPHKL